MKSKVIEIFNPYTILPPYGENSIRMLFENNKLILSVYYDSETSSTEQQIDITFINIYYHKLVSIPGLNDSSFKEERYDCISSLVELTNSEFKLRWEMEYSDGVKLRHYRIIFAASNYMFEVLCKDVITPY